jgi:PEGA domain-containing protein
MEPHEALRSTMLPQAVPRPLDLPQASAPIALPHVSTPMPESTSLGRALAILAGAVLVGLVIGIWIGRATTSDTPSATPPPQVAGTPDYGHVGVTSQPTDGNVTVDGRFVGVTPVERLDLDPGKHSIVIDAFGFQPYAGTLAIEPKSKVNLKVLLAPIGGTATTSGNVSGGGGTATKVVVPPSALQPAAAPAPAKAEKKEAPKPRRVDYDDYSPPPRVEYTPPPPPPRPKRDCYGEEYQCKESCRKAETDCNFSCNTCSSCSSSIGSDECRRQCDMCRSSCDRNTKFCQTTCEGQRNSCQASNNY